MKALTDWLIIAVLFFGGVFTNAISGLFLAKISRRFLRNRQVLVQIVSETVAFSFGMGISMPVVFGVVILLTGGGYGILAFEALLIGSGVLQIFVYFGFSLWRKLLGHGS